MTDDTGDTGGESERTTMADVDHTHPHTDETFAATGVYDRGNEKATGD